ncbi:MAG: Nif11 family protein [Candidatus Spyradosoma sp.]
MPKETVEKFYAMLKHKPEEAQAFEKAILDAAPKTKEEAAAAVIAFAKARGFDFSFDDLKDFSNAAVQEMTPEELEKLCGGDVGFNPADLHNPSTEKNRGGFGGASSGGAHLGW